MHLLAHVAVTHELGARVKLKSCGLMLVHAEHGLLADALRLRVHFIALERTDLTMRLQISETYRFFHIMVIFHVDGTNLGAVEVEI